MEPTRIIALLGLLLLAPSLVCRGSAGITDDQRGESARVRGAESSSRRRCLEGWPR